MCNLILNISFLMIMRQLLLIDGDVESNPGPTYNIVKLIKASFRQCNPMFGETDGIQCACNALFAICYSKIKKPGSWNTCDLDYVLIKGDQLFKSINLMRYLGVEDLPHKLNMGVEASVKIKYVQNIDVEIKDQCDFPRPSFDQFSNDSNGIIFYVNQMTISLVWDTKSFFCLFDSLSRDEQGKITENGTGILIKFSSLSQIQKYLSENVQTTSESVLGQLQYVNVEIDSSQCSSDQLKKAVY